MRDAARDTLAKISVSLGTQYFSFVLKELRGSLTRGYQVKANYQQLSKEENVIKYNDCWIDCEAK